MKKLIVPITMFLFYSLLSCSKTGPVPTITIPPIVADTLPYEWKVPQSTDGFVNGTIDPIIYNDNVLISARKNFDNETLRMFDGKDGTLIWEWNDYISGSGNIATGHAIPTKGNQVFINANFREIYALNMDNGQLDWSHQEETARNNSIRISLVNDHIYYNLGQSGDDPSPFDSISHLVRTSIEGFNQWDTVYTEIEGGDKIQRFILPQGYINDKGEEIITFIYDRADLNATLGETYLLAYNLTQDTLVYKTGSWDRLASVRLPLIKDSKVFIPLKRTFSCFNIETGDLIWKKEFDGGLDNLISSRSIIYENMVIVKMTNDDLYAWDINTGNEIWHIPDAGIVASPLKIHDGFLYYVGDKLRAIDVIAGEIIWSYESPFTNHFDGHGVAINPDLDYLYATDGLYLYGIPLLNR